MKKTNIEEIADRLQQAWIQATMTYGDKPWIAVAKAAVECAGEKAQYRDLTHEDTIQEGDEVWAFGTGPWNAVSESEHGQKYRNGYNKMRRLVADSTLSNDQLYKAVIANRNAMVAELQNTLDKWEEACRAKDRDIDKLQAHNAILQTELRDLGMQWGQVINFIIDNNIGVVGHTFPEIVLKELQRKSSVDSRVEPLVAKLERIEKATIRLRGYREINSHDPAQCIEEAAAMIQKLRHIVRQLENDRLAKPCLTMMGEQLKKDLDQTRDDWNKDHMEMKRKLDAAAEYIEKLEQDLSFRSEHGSDAEYYLGVLNAIGDLFGARARIDGDGHLTDEVLVPNLVELVRRVVVVSELLYREKNL